MPLSFKCPHCETPLTVPDKFAGKAGKCPKCNSRVVAPLPQARSDELVWMSAVAYEEMVLSGTPLITEAATPVAKAIPVPEAGPKLASPRSTTEAWGSPRPLPAADAVPESDPQSGPRLTIVSEGRIQGVVFPIGDFRCSVVGRDPKNEVAIPSSAISRHHCQIERSGGDYVLTDLGSANGTLVNSERTISCELKHGDYIQVGDTLLRFDLE